MPSNTTLTPAGGVVRHAVNALFALCCPGVIVAVCFGANPWLLCACPVAFFVSEMGTLGLSGRLPRRSRVELIVDAYKARCVARSTPVPPARRADR
jgi:hypothetical protein